MIFDLCMDADPNSQGRCISIGPPWRRRHSLWAHAAHGLVGETDHKQVNSRMILGSEKELLRKQNDRLDEAAVLG